MRTDPLPDLSGLTLLLVDDDRNALQGLTTLLTACGADVLSAGTASAALAYLETAVKIDVLVSDLSMPEMDGIELIQRVRRHSFRHQLPAIALSGVWMTYWDARGFDTFLAKPVDFDQLCAAIHSVIDVRRGAGPFPLRSGIRITPLHPSLGAEVAGVDLSQPVDDVTRGVLTRALADHLALVLHDQSLTPAQYLSAAAVFGPPMEQHYSQHHMPGFPLIGLIWHRNGQQPAEQWHTDHTNRERPPAATILYGVEIPSAGGGTSVANMRAAYGTLPEDERRRLESLTTFNGLDGHADTREDDRAKYGEPIEHPMVRTHPVHGSRAVYFHISKATHISGMTAEASKRYMGELLDRMIQPSIVYHHRWRRGDVLIIDNRATMHRAHGDYDRDESRILWRIIVEGDRPRLT